MMKRGDVRVGGVYYTDGGLPCEVVALAGEKVIFKMTLHDGTVRSLDSSVGRFVVMNNLTNPVTPP